MRATIGSLIAALALLAAGGISWALGRAERAVATTEEQLVTMQYAAASDRADTSDALRYATLVPGVGNSLAGGARNAQSAATYWQAKYDALKPVPGASASTSARDPEEWVLASNAAFRATAHEAVDRDTALNHLEAVIKNYAETLKANPDSEDAAYNYEFVVRTRDTLARAKIAPGPPKPLVAEATTQTIHGRPGAPPKGVNMAGFKVLVPKQSDERSGGEEAGKGGVKVRKG
jgi:hypothetical protein